MSNILRVTTPVAGYDNTNVTKTGQVTTEQNNIQGQVNPGRVVKPDARSDSGAQEQNVGMKFQHESNFANFITQVKTSPTMLEEFSSVLFERLGIIAESGIGEHFAKEISEFLTMIQVPPQEMAAFLKTQGDAAVRYTGPFFQLLRQVMKGTSSVEVKTGVLDFLKRYTDMAEGQHIMENIKGQLGAIKEQMFKSGRQQLEEIEQLLTYGKGTPNGDTAANAKILKEQILPFLNLYIGKTHDRGELRENTAMMAAQIARYENGETGRILEAFEKLMEYPIMQKFFRGLETDQLLEILRNTGFEKASQKNESMEKLAEIIQKGVKGEAGVENKQVFRNLMQAILLNESVYMPVLHMMLPLTVDGRMMFSEMWIDPDADKEQESAGQSEQEGRTIKGLVKFDIEDVGFFDLFFLYREGKVSLQIHYPQEFASQEKEIRNQVSQIITENGMSSEELIFGTSRVSIPISEAFPQIFERKNAVNVKI